MRDAEVMPDNSSLAIMTAAEIDTAITTAKTYPRDIKAFQEECMALVSKDEKVASDCVYAVPRGGKTIEGPSARFAEALIYTWGNCIAGARVVGEEEGFIVAQGVFHDLQKNSKIMYEVKRKITDRKGKRFNADMIQVTANAACSIALRNAALKAVPKAYWEPMYLEARKTIVGDSSTMANKAAEALAFLQKFGATEDMVLALLNVEKVADIKQDHIVTLRGIATTIKDGDTTVEQAFGPDTEEKAGGAQDVMDKFKDGKSTEKKETPAKKAVVPKEKEEPAAKEEEFEA